MLPDKNGKLNVKVEIILLVIQLGVNSVVVTYDECQIQVIYLVIQSISFFNVQYLVTHGNPQRCNSMIAKRSIQLWVSLPQVKVLVLVIIFLVKVL